MPYIKQRIYNIMKSKAESELQAAQYKLLRNKNDIKRLAQEQRDLKQLVAECSRLMSEFQKREQEE